MRTPHLTLSVLLLSIASPALAQMGSFSGAPGGGQAGGIKPATENKKTTLPAPDAVPGAKARPDSVTPLTRGTGDLPPTEALFDAINRGDISTARDAINRGADLDSTNLLGLTPIELSVDLGRNDISFLLLSLRGAAPSPSAPAVRAAAAPVTPHVRRVPMAAPPRDSAVVARRAPALFAGDGGAPVPAAGFLGFDPKH